MHAAYDKSLSNKVRGQIWRKLLEEWDSSNQSQQDFCEEQNIKLEDLKRWLYRIKPKPNKLDVSIKNNKTSPFFVPLEVKSNTTTLLLEHRSGFSIHISSATDNHLLRKTLQLLGELTC